MGGIKRLSARLLIGASLSLILLLSLGNWAGMMRIILFSCIFVLAFSGAAQAQIKKMAIAADGKTYVALSEANDESFLITYSVTDSSAKPAIFKLGESKTGAFFYGWRRPCSGAVWGHRVFC